jgi:hypothetical protein
MKFRRFSLLIAVVMMILSTLGNGAVADWEVQHSLAPDSMVYLPACYTDDARNPYDIGVLWTSASGVLFAAGDDGMIFRHDNTGWNDMSVDTDATAAYFKDIWGAGADDVFAVGLFGVIFHYDGHQWRQMKSATYQSLASVWGASVNDVFAVGENGGIVHFNGSVWAPMASWTDESLVYVNGNSGSDVFAVANSGHVYRYDGASWKKVTEGTQMPEVYLSKTMVTGDSIRNIYAVFENTVMHFDGQGWMAVEGNWGDLRIGYLGSFGETICLIGYDNDVRQHFVIYKDGHWQTFAQPEALSWAIAIAGISENDVTLFGYLKEKGFGFFHYGGNAWTLIGDNTPRNVFTGVWGATASDVFAVGEKGMIYRNGGSGWQPVASGITADLKDVWGSRSTNVLAVGNDGMILRYDGNQWAQLVSGTDKNLTAIDGDSTGHAYIVGAAGTIIGCDGDTCTPLNSGTDRDLTGVWVSDTGSVHAVGMGATYLINEGNAWLPAGGLPEGARTVYGIWGSSATDIYFIMGVPSPTTYDEIYHFDGLAWEWEHYLVLGPSGTIWGRNAGDVFYVPSGSSAISHFDGTGWSTMVPIADTGFRDVWATETDVFLVGENGTILHASRPDSTKPRILSVSPQNGATGVKTDLPSIEILFSEPVEGKMSEYGNWKVVPVSITDKAGNPVYWEGTNNIGSFTSGGAKVQGWPFLAYGTSYTVTVPGETADFAGNEMGKDYTWSFTTEAEPSTTEAGVWITDELWIRAQINTGDKGEIEGRWQLGGEDTTARGDRVIWGYFYASPADVAWGNAENPDLFVKIWFDISGNLYISYFHVSVPEIRVWSSYPYKDGLRNVNQTIATLSSRHVGHFYYYSPEQQCYFGNAFSQFEDGRPPAGDAPRGAPSGYELTDGLRIGAVIKTEDKGPIDGIWNKGGEGTTQRGDTVLWGHFYADPAVMNWGSTNNPDLFVKAWYDISGAVFLDFFHVSVPDIEVFSEMPTNHSYDNKGTTTLGNRFIEHRYQR